MHAQTNRRTSEEARLIELLAARCCTGGSKRAKAGEIVNRSIILNPILLQDTPQRPIDLGVSSSYLRDELEGHRGACCRTSSLPPIAFFRSGFALHPADCVRLPQLPADADWLWFCGHLNCFTRREITLKKSPKSTMPCMHCARCEGVFGTLLRRRRNQSL